MSQQTTIREKYAQGDCVTEIARALNIDRKTVYRYLEQDDFSPTPPVVKPKISKLDPYKPIIDKWLEDDRNVFHKQRHTIGRIQERLEEEHGFMCGYSTIQNYVRETKRARREQTFLDLSWCSGSAQADFGEADCIVDNIKIRCHYLTLSFPYSNMGYLQLFFGETAECVAQGLIDIFNHIGGVPPLIVFDNATGVGRRFHDVVTETELFSRLRAHYLFEVKFCNPSAGWEKGNVERKVSYLRKKLLVPIPQFKQIVPFNEELLGRCSFQEVRPHYEKETSIGELFREDCAAFLSLPDKEFKAIRYESYTSDGWGNVCVDGCHTYSTIPENTRAKTIVGIGAHTIVALAPTGEVLAEHTRRFGKKKTKSVDPAQSVYLLSKKPGGWKNSHLRRALPPSVTEHMDKYTHQELRRDLSLLAEAVEKSGFESSMDAIEAIAQRNPEKISFFEVGVLAARIANFGLDTPVVEGADLTHYDKVFLGGDQSA